MQLYAGFSSLNHAIVGIIAAKFAIELIVNRRFQAINCLLTLIVIAKLLWEAAWAHPLRVQISWGFAVVQAAHLSGFCCGLLTASGIYAAQILFTNAVVE